MWASLKKNLMTGLAILLPIAVTIALLSFLINLFTAPFVDFVSVFLMKFHIKPEGFLFLSSEQVVKYISKFLILVCLFFILVLLGIITRWFVVNSFFSLTEKILHRIPVVSMVYKASQEIIKTFFKPEQTAFKQVVMVPFPRHDTYALGLVSKEAPAVCNAHVNTKMVSVLVPTTPNPTSGFLLMYDPKDIIYIDMKPEVAIKYILSMGLISPEDKK